MTSVTTEAPLLRGVWADLVGQEQVVATLQRAVAAADSRDDAGDGVPLGAAMTHAWLITGPPGSGRSNAARAFAAALQCRLGGCGRCDECATAVSGAHPDVTLVRTEQLSIGIGEVRALALKASLRPVRGRWQVIVIEDADRLTLQGANGMLRSLEEPPARTVWLLCAPSAEDVILTIRSRTREVRLVTPRDEAVAQLLIRRDGADKATAQWAARAAQGHIGRARAFASDQRVRQRRQRVLAMAGSLTSLGACLEAAAELVESVKQDVQAATAELDAQERTALEASLGLGTRGVKARHTQTALGDLEKDQKARATRLQRDSLDWIITELTTWHRDLLAVQLIDAPAESIDLVNPEQAAVLTRLAGQLTPRQTLRRIDALLLARTRLDGNVAPLLAMEALLISLAVW